MTVTISAFHEYVLITAYKEKRVDKGTAVLRSYLMGDLQLERILIECSICISIIGSLR